MSDPWADACYGGPRSTNSLSATSCWPAATIARGGGRGQSGGHQRGGHQRGGRERGGRQREAAPRHSIITTSLPRASREPKRAMASAPRASGNRPGVGGLLG